MCYCLLLSQTHDLCVICFRVLGVLPGDLCEKCVKDYGKDIGEDIWEDIGEDIWEVDQEKGGGVKKRKRSENDQEKKVSLG